MIASTIITAHTTAILPEVDETNRTSEDRQETTTNKTNKPIPINQCLREREREREINNHFLKFILYLLYRQVFGDTMKFSFNHTISLFTYLTLKSTFMRCTCCPLVKEIVRVHR